MPSQSIESPQEIAETAKAFIRVETSRQKFTTEVRSDTEFRVSAFQFQLSAFRFPPIPAFIRVETQSSQEVTKETEVDSIRIPQ